MTNYYINLDVPKEFKLISRIIESADNDEVFKEYAGEEYWNELLTTGTKEEAVQWLKQGMEMSLHCIHQLLISIANKTKDNAEIQESLKAVGIEPNNIDINILSGGMDAYLEMRDNIVKEV